MRNLVLFIALLASPAAAEGWQVMYLASGGGSRPVQVGPGEGGIPFPHVDNDRGERLILGCPSGGDPGQVWTLAFHPGQDPTVLPKDAEGTRIIVTFEGNPATHDIGRFTFVQGAFRGHLDAIVATDIRQAGGIRLDIPGEDVRGGMAYRTEFTLAGARAAIDTACPPL